MPFSAFDPVDEDRRNEEVLANQQKMTELKSSVTPDVAQRAAEIYKRAPYIPANVILSMAKSGTSDAAVNGVAKQAALTTAKQLDPNKDQQRGWFSKVVGDPFKSATRWTFAGLSLLPDLAQNIGAEILNPNDPAGMDGWFKSTQLGTLIADSDKAGSGFFMAGQAAENQAARARRFRGEINGHAWTLGRGAAQLVFTPGSKAYNVMSGFVDAAVQFGADPTLIGGKVAKTARISKGVIQGLEGAEEATVFAKAAQRGLAGLSEAEQIAFDGSKFSQWVTTNKQAQRLVLRIVDRATDTNLAREDRILKVLEDFDFRIDPETAGHFADADSVEKVHGILGTASNRLANNPDNVLLPKSIGDVYGAQWGRSFDDAITDRVPGWQSWRHNRYFSKMPKGSVVINGSGLDKSDAIRTYSNYMKGIGIKEGSDGYNKVMRKVVGAYMTTAPGDSRPAVREAFNTALDEILGHAGVGGKQRETVVKEIMAKRDRVLTQVRTYGLDETGYTDDGGFMQGVRELVGDEAFREMSPDQLNKLVLAGPQTLAEMAEDVLVLPDFREMRRATGALRMAFNSKTVERAAYLTEFVQQEIWKPLTLATGGYIVRNMMDAQTRIAMSGLKGFFLHPIDYIMWATHRKGLDDVLGNEWIVRDEFGKVNWNAEQTKFVEAMEDGVYRWLEDPAAATDRQLRTGDFSMIRRGVDPKAHTTGYVDNIRQLHGAADSINRKLAQLSVQGYSDAKRVELVQEWLMSEAGAKTRERVARYLQEGIKYSDPDTGVAGFIQVPADQVDQVMGYWVDRLVTFRNSTITRGDRDLDIVTGFNRVPKPEAPIKMAFDELDPKTFIVGEGDQGTIILDGAGNESLITRMWDKNTPEIDPFTGRETVTSVRMVEVQPVHAGDALAQDVGSAELRNLLDMKGNRGQLSDVVKIAGRGDLGDPNLQSKALEAKNTMVDWFFGKFYGGKVQTWEKSPVFRQFYYREIGTVADQLAPAEAQKILDTIQKSADSLNISPAKVVGDKKLLKALQDQAASTSNAIGTVEEADLYAKAVAVRETKELLYNATERSNIQDILRVIVPFGPAWKEVLGTYVSSFVEDPTRIRKAQLIFDGGRKFDPDGNGKGFFYKDATTGEYSFNFPLSGDITKLLTGVKAPMQAPVKRLSIGLGIFPSIGPVAKIAAEKIIPDTPSTDWISGILFPYGRGQGFDVVPKWARRLSEAWAANTQNLSSVYGNTYIETVRALSASGEYDLANLDEQEKLYADAKQKARVLTGLRALGQFIGPTSPVPEFQLDNIKGDPYGTELVKEFQKLQAENYDTAVQRFLDQFGNDALLYVSNKTESIKGGLEATDQFGDWERGNRGLLNKYPDVAGFMAPGGDNFSFEVWSRQVTQGDRRRLTERELVALAQYRVASAKYRSLRAKLPASPSQAQKQWLKSWRVELNKEYPGFPVVAEFNPGEFPKKIEQMQNMVNEESLADNDVAQALKTYLDSRTKAIESANQAGYAGLSAGAAAPLRDWLASIGRSLVQTTPEFARVYDRILSNEVEE